MKPEFEARRALVLDDQPLLINLIELTLNHGRFVVRAARTLAGAETILADWRPHLAVVDMDNDDAEEMLRRLGSSRMLRRGTTPVLGLTRDGDLKTRLRAFSLGVDDIISVPFSPEELLARSIVISRRASGTELTILPVIKIGEIEVDIVNRQVRSRDSIAHLSGIEQSILYVLASQAGRVVSRSEVLDVIWGRGFVAEGRIVDRHIRSLRIKLQDDFRRPRFIATVPGQGYRFVPIYRNEGWASESTESDGPSPDVDVGTARLDSSPPARRPSRRRPHRDAACRNASPSRRLPLTAACFATRREVPRNGRSSPRDQPVEPVRDVGGAAGGRPPGRRARL